ncbi:hypothetical protein [Egbenema bharatensis]|jgi:hypothetical protein|uniref:hypothetical protein n=1 Tax=Egbenema bharatensis TaxID=3463334 RepID=UPI003A8A2203
MRLLFLLFGGAITATGLAGLAMLSVIAESAATRVQDVIASCVPTLPEDEEEEEEEETTTESQRRT